MFRKYIDKLLAGAERNRAMTREINETDFAAALVDYAVMLGKNVESLTPSERRQGVVNYVLRDGKGS